MPLYQRIEGRHVRRLSSDGRHQPGIRPCRRVAKPGPLATLRIRRLNRHRFRHNSLCPVRIAPMQRESRAYFQDLHPFAGGSIRFLKLRCVQSQRQRRFKFLPGLGLVSRLAGFEAGRFPARRPVTSGSGFDRQIVRLPPPPRFPWLPKPLFRAGDLPATASSQLASLRLAS